MDLLPKEQFVLSRDVDFDQIFRIPIGDYEVGLIVIFCDKDDVWIVFDFFFGDEGHHVFGVPAAGDGWFPDCTEIAGQDRHPHHDGHCQTDGHRQNPGPWLWG